MNQLEKDNQGLEKIIALQLQYEATLKEALEGEKRVSGTLLNKWLDREQTLSDWGYSYWLLQQKFTKAIKDIRFLNHYIETKVKGKRSDKKEE